MCCTFKVPKGAIHILKLAFFAHNAKSLLLVFDSSNYLQLSFRAIIGTPYGIFHYRLTSLNPLNSIFKRTIANCDETRDSAVRNQFIVGESCDFLYSCILALFDVDIFTRCTLSLYASL